MRVQVEDAFSHIVPKPLSTMFGLGSHAIFIFINDLPISTVLEDYLFAHDVKLIGPSDDIDALTGDLRKTWLWTATWDELKCEEMFPSPSKTKSSSEPGHDEQ